EQQTACGSLPHFRCAEVTTVRSQDTHHPQTFWWDVEQQTACGSLSHFRCAEVTTVWLKLSTIRVGR
ncbi:MAG: hypothetical protein IKQ97_03315, partial [Eubacterium sp.]|nr:hypothetical protein [Eubacterium sp.]